VERKANGEQLCGWKALFDLAKKQKRRIWGAPAVVNSPQFAFMSKTLQEGKLGQVARHMRITAIPVRYGRRFL
jgi:hypothetical protein